MAHQGEYGHRVFEADFFDREVDFLLRKHGTQLSCNRGGKDEILPGRTGGEEQYTQLFGEGETGKDLENPGWLFLNPAD